MSVDRSILRCVGFVLFAIGAVFALIWTFRVVRAGQSLFAHVKQMQSMADQGVGAMDPNALGDVLIGLRRDVVALKRQVGWLAPIGSLFRWMPSVGPILDQAPALLSLADGGTQMAVLFWEDLAPALSSSSTLELPLIREALTRFANHLPAKQRAAEQILHAYNQIDCAAFPDSYEGPCERVAPWVALLPPIVQRLDALPDLAGFEDPQIYLLVALNEDELRPGGGFISGVGEIWIVKGKIASLEFRDSYSVDDFSEPYPTPPWPLETFMGLDLWVFRDSNWSPDFPTAVEEALPLYRTGLQQDIDGVIAADQASVQALVGAIGPLAVPNADKPVDADNVIAYMHEAWAPEDDNLNREWWRQRKTFMGDLATAMMNKLQGGDIDWVVLAETGLDLVESKDLQVTTTNADINEFLAGQQWDGGLYHDSAGDYLMVVEANLGFNKASQKIERDLRYEVDLSTSPVQVALYLTYAHSSQVDIDCVPEFRYDLDYVTMMDRCYWAFVRALVPAGADLIQVSEHPIAADHLITGEAWSGQARISEMTASSGERFTVFSQAFLLPTASETTLHFVYQLPEGAVYREQSGSYTYRLKIQKQPGVSAFPARVILRTPENAIVSHIQPDDCLVNHTEQVICRLDISRDQIIELRYKIPEEAQP